MLSPDDDDDVVPTLGYLPNFTYVLHSILLSTLHTLQLQCKPPARVAIPKHYLYNHHYHSLFLSVRIREHLLRTLHLSREEEEEADAAPTTTAADNQPFSRRHPLAHAND